MSHAQSKWRHLLAILLSLVLVATACGSSDEAADSGTADDVATETDAGDDAGSDTADSADTADEAEPEAEPEPTPEPVEVDQASVISDECAIPNPADEREIDVMGWEFPIVTQYADEMEECEDGNYSFNIQFLDSAEARDAMTLDASTGEPTFEIYQGSNSFIIELGNQGYLTPLNDLIAKYGDEYGLDEVDQAFFDFNSIDGNIYAVPMVSNTMHQFYNEPAMAEAGVEVPTTFAEAIEACQAIQDAGYDTGYMYMLSAGWSWQIEFDSVLGSLGKTNVDPVTGEPQFNSPEGIEAAQTLLDMHETCGGSASGTYSTDDIQAAFQTGEVILGHTWASRAAAMDDEEASTEVGNIQFAPALSTGGDILASPAYTDGYGIPVGVEGDIDEIFLAIMAATDRESQEAAAAFGLVTREGVSNPDGPRDGAAAAVSLVDGRGPDLSHPAAGIARAKLGESLIKLLDGESVEDVLAEAEANYLDEANAQGLITAAGAAAAAGAVASFDEVISDECAIPPLGDDMEIDVMGWEFPIVTQYADEMEECEDGGYDFNIQFLDSAEARDAMTLDASTGEPTFEIYQGSNSFIIELGNQGYLTPLNDLIAKYGAAFGLDEVDQAFFDFNSIDGNIYAVPMVSNTMHQFYNEPAMAEAGVEVPTTFAEAIEACQAIQDAGYDTGYMYMLSAGWSWQIEFDSVLGSLGKTNVDPVTGEPQFNSPEGIEAAQTLLDMHETCGGAASGTYSTDDIQAAFQTGEVILGHTWASRAAAMDDEEASTEVGNIQFAPALSTGGDILASPAYTDGYGIPVGVEGDVDAIFLAIMAATDRESQEAAAAFGLVTREGVSNPDGPRDGAAAAVSLVDGRGPDLSHPAAGIARAKLGESLIKLLDGESVEDVLAEAEANYLEEAEAQGLLG